MGNTKKAAATRGNSVRDLYSRTSEKVFPIGQAIDGRILFAPFVVEKGKTIHFDPNSKRA